MKLLVIFTLVTIMIISAWKAHNQAQTHFDIVVTKDGSNTSPQSMRSSRLHLLKALINKKKDE